MDGQIQDTLKHARRMDRYRMNKEMDTGCTDEHEMDLWIQDG